MSGWATERSVDCGECGAAFLTKHRRQRFCTACGDVRRRKSVANGLSARKACKSEVLQSIAETRGRQETRLTDVLDHPVFAWRVMYSVPFDAAVSKNRRWSNNGQGSVFLTKSVRDYQAMVVAATRAALKSQTVHQNKLWLSFFVEKPNNRFDAVNVVDTLCDAIKVAADLDDRWFCIGKIDWVIKKNDPQIVIAIGQEANEHVIACSHCGEIKSLDHFGKKSSNPLGRSRVCVDCKREIDQATRRVREPIQ